MVLLETHSKLSWKSVTEAQKSNRSKAESMNFKKYKQDVQMNRGQKSLLALWGSGYSSLQPASFKVLGKCRGKDRRRQWHPTPASTLAWKIPWTEEPGRLQSMGLRRVRHDWVTSLSLLTFHFHALEKEMATHSSVLAWRTPGTGEPGGLPSMGLQSRTRLKRLSSSSSIVEQKLSAILIGYSFHG